MRRIAFLLLLTAASGLQGCDECSFDSDCSAGLVCGGEGRCVQCAVDADCRDDERCDRGVCEVTGASACGDGVCEGGESCASCVADCGACSSCGDGLCDRSEGCGVCPSDCGTCQPSCGDGRCDANEDCASCSVDCPCSSCGDGVCSGGESCEQCPGDCAPCNECRFTPRAFGGAIVCEPLTPLAQSVFDHLSTVFGIQPNLACRYNGPVTGPCGPLPPRNAIYCPVDRSIAYHAAWLDSLTQRHGGFAPITILAHEWGHLTQDFAGLFQAGRSPVQNELHADCMAGVYAAAAELSGVVMPSDVMAAFTTLCESGDPSYHPNGHGTCVMRIDAFGWGYGNTLQRASAVCTNALQEGLNICRN